MRGHYTINEIFFSPQGEGVRAGTMNIFVRFTGCNLQCRMEEGPLSPGGFDCDTEFMSGRKMTGEEIVSFAQEIAPRAKAVIRPRAQSITRASNDSGPKTPRAACRHGPRGIRRTAVRQKFHARR